MTKSIELIKKAFLTLFTTAFIVGLLFVIGCDNSDDPEPELYQLPGVYTFNKAILQTAFNIPGLNITIPAERDITDEMKNGLLAEAPCDNPENGAVELKSSMELFFTCIGESNELKSGTWSVNGDTTELTLNLVVAAGALPLKISDLEINESTNVIGGSILNFPITKSLLAGFLAGIPGGEVILAGIDENYVQPVDVDIEFKKEP